MHASLIFLDTHEGTWHTQSQILHDVLKNGNHERSHAEKRELRCVSQETEEKAGFVVQKYQFCVSRV